MTINSRAINGFSAPGWVIAAAALAAAVASADATSNRIAHSSAFGDAAVYVDVVGTHIVPARVNATARCESLAEPITQYLGVAAGSAVASGSAAVLRDVFAFASGDASCVGSALTASALGEVDGSAEADVVLCRGHIIHPGASSANASASQGVNSSLLLVTRKPTVIATAGVEFSRGESSIKKSGQSYYQHDGYVLSATGRCSGSVLPDRILVISTIGSFAFGESDGSARPLIRHTATSTRQGQSESISAAPTAIRPAYSYSQAGSTGSASQTLYTPGDSFAIASATSYRAKALMRIASAVDATAACEQVICSAKLLAWSSSFADAGSIAVIAEFAKQYPSSASGSAQSYAVSIANITKKSSASGFAVAYGDSDAKYLLGGSSYAMASSSGIAGGISNADKPAPLSRTMMLYAEYREMMPSSEERTMMVTA